MSATTWIIIILIALFGVIMGRGEDGHSAGPD